MELVNLKAKMFDLFRDKQKADKELKQSPLYQTCAKINDEIKAVGLMIKELESKQPVNTSKEN